MRKFRSVSGVEPFDRLAVEYPDELTRFLKDVTDGGWIVKSTTKLDAATPAYFFPRKGRFYFDPERMTYLDLLHERKHLERLTARGNCKLGKGGALLFADEIAAYTHEWDILLSAGGAAPDYLEYLRRQIGYYEAMARGEGASPRRPARMDDPFFKRAPP